MACIYALRPAPDTSTIEGLDQMIGDALNFLMYFSNFLVWLYASIIDYFYDRLEVLEKKADKYDALCELVEELRKANEIDRNIVKDQDHRIRLLEERIR